MKEIYLSSLLVMFDDNTPTPPIEHIHKKVAYIFDLDETLPSDRIAELINDIGVHTIVVTQKGDEILLVKMITYGNQA